MADARGGRVLPDGKARPVAGPGKLSQRTDLSQPPAGQGVYVAPGSPYGTRKRLEEAQQVVPVPARRTTPQAAAPPPMAPGQIPTLAQILARPTDRPDEPPTAGLRGGPGPGPEVLPPEIRAPQRPSISGILQEAAAKTGSPDLMELAQRAQAFGQ